MPRVAGCDPGTSSLDVLVLHDGTVADQARFAPADLRADPAAPVRWLRNRGPFDRIAGPSGYGLPLVGAADCTDAQLDLMSLVRPDERAAARGVGGFSAAARAFRDSGLPVVFLPGVIHLPTVPAHRKLNRIDLGTPDKLCVAAMTESQVNPADTYMVLELGSAFTAGVVVRNGEVIDGFGGTSGAVGQQSGGAWDGEAAYLLSPLGKADLFRGGVADAPEHGPAAFRESVLREVYGRANLHGVGAVWLAGRLIETDGDAVRDLSAELARHLPVCHVGTMPGATVKQAAQGAAVIADGLAGGRFAPVVDRLRLRKASGTVLDHLTHPRADDVRGWFGLARRG